ncbi:DNA translocase FtsK [Limibaculum sp. FT325]|uniref:DNA translocase FtsK n=1 Tax=Thermohalobaculum sediminis TaxID=2939436 RepID=UPI0020BD7F6C|nr:DNA translocase FtsK [Limibaculum sediminis]MCL5776497.1 DNA translocase FtsK [Limibaculum sediminis]
MALIWGMGEDSGRAGSGAGRALRAVLKRAGGSLVLVLAVALALALASFDATDPSFFSATPKPPANWLGPLGAMVAAPVMQALGLGAWAVAVLLGVWGWRFAFGRGEERIWVRLLAMPVAVALVSIFAALHAPWAGWQLSLGLGGMVGDEAGHALLGLLPALSPQAVLWGTLGAALVALGVLGFALGLSGAETRAILGWLWHSLAAVLHRLLRILGRGLRAALSLARRPAPAEPALPRSERLEPARPTGSWRRPGGAAPDAEPAGDEADDTAVPSAPARRGFGLGALARRLTGRGDEPAADRPLGRLDAIDEPPVASALRRREPELARRPAEPQVAAPASPAAPAGPAGDDRALSAAIRSLNAAGTAPAAAEAWEDEDDDLPPSRPAVAGVGSQRLPRKSRRAEREAQPTLFDGDAEGYAPPPLALLAKPIAIQRPQMSQAALEENARMLETVLEDYGVRGEITAVKAGPVVTLYELEPAPGLKASRVIGLSDDIARSMSALSARVSTVPGRSVIGIELPNAEREKVWLREVIETPEYGDGRVMLSLVLGKDIEGRPVVANLAKMPHLLIAGTTGSGKSVAINTMILSLLYKLSPQQCRLIMIDPKMLELSVYDNIPHLLAPVVTDPKKAIVALKWVVAEMEERYRKMSKMGVRNIDGYNARVRDALDKGEEFSRTIQTGFDETTGEPIYETEFFEPEEMPFIVVIVDEMADLMMVAGKEIEACIQRLAQMARASGIHLIMATQRPSVDVITGTIKANFPTRISFQVTSKIDSRTILGEQGAEQLLGQGDMLYMAGGGRIRRVHGPFVSDEEVEEIVRHLKAQGQPDYVGAVTEGADDEVQAIVDEKLGLAQPGDSDDELYDRAVAIVARDRKCSTSYIQRKLAIGYNKAARLVEMMENQGVVSPANAVGKREILIEER